jgi:hypothetical protein
MKAEYIDDSRSYILRLEKDEKNFTYIWNKYIV